MLIKNGGFFFYDYESLAMIFNRQFIAICEGREFYLFQLGVAQMHLKLGDLKYNLEKLDEMLEMASQKSVDILVLPELANSGYCFGTKQVAVQSSEIVPKGSFSERLRIWSKKKRFVVTGINELEDNVLYNSAAAFSDGKHLGTYRKYHLYGSEKKWFRKGTQSPPVFDYQGYRISVIICFEWRFPELVDIAARKGAQLIMHPINSGSTAWQSAMIDRSTTKRVFSASANRVGEESCLSFKGNSQIISPRGEVLLRMDSSEIGVGTVPFSF